MKELLREKIAKIDTDFSLQWKNKIRFIGISKEKNKTVICEGKSL